MVPKHQPNSSFGKWLLKYRLKLILFAFIIIIPASFIIALYVGDYLKHKSVDFDDTAVSNFQSTQITLEDETEHQTINLETNELIVQIKLIDFMHIEYYDDTDGHYTFKSRYEEKSGKHVHDIKVKFVVKTEWMDAKSVVTSIPVTSSYSTNRRISFNHMLPKSPLWFVHITDPYLYVEVSYEIDLALGQTETVKHYFKTYLGQITPTNLTDELNKES